MFKWSFFSKSCFFLVSFLFQVPLSRSDWINVLYWSIPILFVDEILKFIGRWIYREEQEKRAKLIAEEKAAI